MPRPPFVVRSHTPQDNPSFITLFRDLETYQDGEAYKGADAYTEVLLPWQDTVLKLLDELRSFGDREAIGWRMHDPGSPRDEQQQRLWWLYHLSRISDLLLLPFQQVKYPNVEFWGETWSGPPLRLENRTAWFLALGFQLIQQSMFHPFYHEIVEVEQTADPAEPITLEQTIWPGFMLGHMLFCRAGVKVRGGAQVIRREIAEESTLYWAYRRNNRPANDLSHGWGSNSQWWTNFRRDYVDGSFYYYNVDEDTPQRRAAAATDDNPLSPEERIELVQHRCFIVTAKAHDEQFPYYDIYRELRNGSGTAGDLTFGS